MIGVVNGIDFGLSKLTANMSQVGMEQMVLARIENVTEDIGTKIFIPFYYIFYVLYTILSVAQFCSDF